MIQPDIPTHTSGGSTQPTDLPSAHCPRSFQSAGARDASWPAQLTVVLFLQKKAEEPPYDRPENSVCGVNARMSKQSRKDFSSHCVL